MSIRLQHVIKKICLFKLCVKNIIRHIRHNETSQSQTMPFASVPKKVDEGLREVMNKCLKDWENDDLPWSQLKAGIAAFITENCKTKECPTCPDNSDEYKLERIARTSRFLRVTHTQKRSMHYVFDSETGDVGVAKFRTTSFFGNFGALPDDVLLDFLYGHLPEPTLI
jgi:hypothetical protein